jgi:hypothetical protein
MAWFQAGSVLQMDMRCSEGPLGAPLHEPKGCGVGSQPLWWEGVVLLTLGPDYLPASASTSPTHPFPSFSAPTLLIETHEWVGYSPMGQGPHVCGEWRRRRRSDVAFSGV